MRQWAPGWAVVKRPWRGDGERAVVLWIGSVGAVNWAAQPTLLSLRNGRDIRRTDANLTVKPRGPTCTRAYCRGTVARILALPLECSERGGCAVTTIVLYCAHAVRGQFDALAAEAGALQQAGTNGAGNAGTPVAHQRTAYSVRNFGRGCLISIHHEGYQLARRQLPLHILRNHDVDIDEHRRGQATCRFLASLLSSDNIKLNCSCGSLVRALDCTLSSTCSLSLRLQDDYTKA